MRIIFFFLYFFKFFALINMFPSCRIMGSALIKTVHQRFDLVNVDNADYKLNHDLDNCFTNIVCGL